MSKPFAISFDRLEHYNLNVGPVQEFGDLPECEVAIKTIGWTLGNDCPYCCTHCYSMNAREKGSDLTVEMIDRIVDQLKKHGVETVNLGGNELLFTNGSTPKATLLPYIIRRLADEDILVGPTTSGISLVRLYKDHYREFRLLNDCDVSFDSPFEDEHNENRGASIFRQAVEALDICRREGISRTCIMAAMNWNFSIGHIEHPPSWRNRTTPTFRINPIKATEPAHVRIALPPSMYYAGFARLMELCDPVDLGEPPIAAVTNTSEARRCPCGGTSFRIHSISPDGNVHVSPCVYLHDYESEFDLLTNELSEIISSPQFRGFRQRNANPEIVEGCSGCSLLAKCGGGCVARSYLYRRHMTGGTTMLARDPYCPAEQRPQQAFPQSPALKREERLVHMDYFCTWIGQPH
ncbi:radical SAM/SPASM domain-containing protein [Bradyrhizobium sp. WU425]|uniref:radical SAM/SPASM domain-containing protein n=1 Tax=Bradyrhizobium sp. WU425 TaxID=187029 RepID=UPI001E4FEE02|nr:radical SAM protein [Bradyrhizobium canariense]UFW73739.1 radical SAM protein [Bradyrhizobium canariense]